MSRPKPGPARATAGRYRHVYSALWARRDFQALSPTARLVYLNLRTGTQSNLAGIGYTYREALEQETGLDGAALEAALCELEKCPAPARSWIVREGPIIWVRDHLNDSPTRESDPNIANPKHRAAIGYILGTLPTDSLIVKKFRRYYQLGAGRVSHAPSDGVADTVCDSPEIGDRRSEKENGEGDRKRRGRAGEGDPPLAPTPFQFSSSSGKSNNHDAEARAAVLNHVVDALSKRNPTLPRPTVQREAERLVEEQRDKWPGASWSDVFRATIRELDRSGVTA